MGMEQDLSRIFLGCSVRRMRQMVERMEVCVGRLSEEQVWARGSGNENAVGNLLLHLDGNVRQWILSGVGGAEDRRERDAEFNAEGGKGKQAMMERLKETVEAACATMERLDAAQLLETRRIQNYEVTVMEADRKSVV